MPVDYHNHTSRCGHAGGETRDYVLRAIAAGLQEIAITDHLFLYDRLPASRDPRFAMREEELPGYVEEVQRIQEEFSGRIHVRLGIEADYFEGHEARLAEILSRYEWDVVLGSVHWVAGDWIDFTAERMEKGNPERLWQEYWRLLRKACASGFFDVMTHFDLPKKFGNRCPEELEELAEMAVASAAAADVAVECSTAGWRKPVGEQYPSAPVLTLLLHYGVPLTLSSDSHAPAEVAWGYDRLIPWLLEFGVDQVAGFKKRRRHRLAIAPEGAEERTRVEQPIL